MSTYHHGDLSQAILTRAIELIGEAGVEAVSLRQIARELGVSHAAPARHFASKDQLLAAIVRKSYLELTRSLLDDPQRDRTDDPVHRLNAMAAGTIRWAMQNRSKFSVMTNPDVSRFADDGLKTALADFVALISDDLHAAQARGFRADITAETFLLFAIGAALGIATLVTDDLMGSVLGVPGPDADLSELANMIVPVEQAMSAST
jgi:AcrR family transcriptional regulator